jgi:phosphinothricin acetyltransferase
MAFAWSRAIRGLSLNETVTERQGRGARRLPLARPRGIATVRQVSTPIRIDPMTVDDWPEVRRIYAEGIATPDASLEREAPDWNHFDHSHRHDCRLVARARAGGPLLGWTALSAYSARRVYAGVAWESIYVGADARAGGVGRVLLEAIVQASEEAGIWTLLAGVLAENAASLALHASVGFVRVGVQRGMGQDAAGRWRDVVLLQRRSGTVGVG